MIAPDESPRGFVFVHPANEFLNSIPYTPEEWWDPKGKARRDDAIQFYLNMSAGVDAEEKKKQAVSATPKLEFVLHFVKEFFKQQDFFALLKAALFGSK